VFVDAALPEVLDRVANTGVRSFESSVCTIWLRQAEGLKLEAAVGVGLRSPGASQMALGQSVSGLTAVSGTPRRYADVSAEGISEHHELEPYLTGPLLSAPIVFQGEGLGVINLCRQPGEPEFTSGDLDRLVASSSAVALAVAAQRVVTQQNRELKDQDQHLRTLFDDAPNPIFVLDWHGRFLEANAAAANFLERSMSELAGLSLRDTCPPEVVASLWQDLVMQRGGAPREVLFRNRDSEKTLLLNLVPVSVGSAMVYYAIGHDITPLKDFEQELRSSEVRYRRLVSAMPALLCELEPDGRTRYVNPAVETITGYTPDEVRGQSWWELFYPDEADAQVALLSERFRIQGDIRDHQMQLTGKDGQQRVLLWSSANQYHPDGSLAMLVGFGIDITDRHRAEQEKDQLQKQLYLSRRLESVGRLAGGIAHDFNNLLTAILNYASLVAEELTPGSQPHEDVMEIRSAGTRATQLVKQLLAYSRKEVVRPRIVSLNEVLQELLKMLQRLLGEHIGLDLHLDRSLPSIRIDPGQLEQVIVNLAVNAAHAMPQGGELQIRTDVVEMDDARVHQYISVQPGAHVRLRMRDTGAGMPDEVVSKIFEPFFTTKKRGEGTGLGLATVYGIVKQAGGAIFVETTEGQGTQFEVLLPAVEQLPEKRLETGSEHPALGGNERILLVEDSHGVRNIAARLLTRHGYAVQEAASGDEALRLVTEQGYRPDLLLTDVVMPGMSGREVAAIIQRETPSVRVLFMSGYPDSLVTAQGVLIDNVHFLAKPFTAASLMGAVRQALESSPTPIK